MGVAGPLRHRRRRLLGRACSSTRGDGSRAIDDFDPDAVFDNVKEARRTDRFAQFALAVAQMALDQAGEIAVDPLRRGVIFGTGVGGLNTLEEQILTFHDKGPRRVSPFLVPMMMANAGAAAISMRHGWQGPCETIVTACATGAHSIGDAARLVAAGRCDAVLTGSSEAAMTPVGIQGFANMTALSTSGVSRPFDVRRDGFVIAEGAGALVLEDWDHATARGATILAEVLGAGDTADAHHITAPSPGGAGAIACMELALADAGLSPADIAQINAHGTSTPLQRRGRGRGHRQGVRLRRARRSPRSRASPATRWAPPARSRRWRWSSRC